MPTHPRSSARRAAIGYCFGVLGLAACGEGGFKPPTAKVDTTTVAVVLPPRVVSVGVTPAVDTIRIGDTLSVSAQVAVENGAAATVAWASSDTARARVSPNAAGSASVIALARGQVTITARSTADTTKAGEARITIDSLLQAIIAPVRVTPASVGLVAGQTAKLTPSVATANASVRVSYAYTSQNPNVARVDTGGVVTAVAQGNTSISVAATGAGAGTKTTTLPASVSVRVTAAPAYALALNPNTLNITAGQSATADVTLTGLAGGFTGPVTLSVTGAPAGVTVSTVPPVPELSSGASLRLMVAVSTSAAAGSYPLTVRGTAADLTDRTATLTVNVAEAPRPLVITPTVVAGHEYTCQLVATGQAYCWGRNTVGQVGNGTTAAQLTPAPVAGGETFATIVGSGLAASYTCGLTVVRQLLCWGQNPSVGYADGPGNSRSVPTLLAGTVPTFATISPGLSSVCGLTPAGQTICWGINTNGQLGDGTTIYRTTPTPVAAGLTFTALSRAGNSGCGLTDAGRAYCWGDNTYGQLGNGTALTQLNPVPVAGNLTFTSIALGGHFACGLVEGGRPYCWGDNSRGQLGDATYNDRTVPTPVAGGLIFTSLAVGTDHACGLTENGRVFCWGDNTFGEHGDGAANINARNFPVSAFASQAFASIAAGYRHTCGVTTGGQLYCWGNNSAGQLGDGTTIFKRFPTPVSAPSSATRIP